MPPALRPAHRVSGEAYSSEIYLQIAGGGLEQPQYLGPRMSEKPPMISIISTWINGNQVFRFMGNFDTYKTQIHDYMKPC